MLKQVERKRTNFDQIVAVRRIKCVNGGFHNATVIKYGDSSVWVCCPNFGWYEDHNSLKPGCKPRKKRCPWFFNH